MTFDELKLLLDRFEWSDVEFKAARREVPKEAYKTVSAFANSGGGHLVFGIEEDGNNFKIVGVIDADKVHTAFLSTLRSGELLNRMICVEPSVLEIGGERILIFFVPEALRREKPVYLHKDLRQTYIRRGSCDEKCTMDEIERFVRDAANTPFDGALLTDLRAEDFFDPRSLSWYRRIYQERNEGKHANLSDVEFLHEFGYVREHEDDLVPTRAAVLLFGMERNVRQVLNRPVIDYQRIDRLVGEEEEVRWDDRVVIDENLIQAWQILFERYAQLSAHRFALNPSTMRRTNDPPDLVTYREAVVNLLAHQDFGDSRRMPTLKIFRDETQLFNPGDAFASQTELLDPGGKEVRNPTIMAAFRNIGLGEQAGTGIRTIFREWKNLGHVPPVMDNDKAAKCFRLSLNRTTLITEEQQLFQAQLGVRLSSDEARIFALVCKTGAIELMEAKAALAKPENDVRRILGHLVVQGLVDVSDNEGQWALKEHLKASLHVPTDQAGPATASLVTGETDQAAERSPRPVSEESDQAGAYSPSLVTAGSDQALPQNPRRILRTLTADQRAILLFCDIPKRQEVIMDRLGVTHRTHFRTRQLRPLLEAGLLVQTHPDNPTHPQQAYVVAPSALDLLARLADTGSAEERSEE